LWVAIIDYRLRPVRQLIRLATIAFWTDSSTVDLYSQERRLSYPPNRQSCFWQSVACTRVNFRFSSEAVHMRSNAFVDNLNCRI